MENSLELKQQQSPARDINVITAEIKDICRQARATALIFAVEIGRRLEEAKQALPYGSWGDWIHAEFEFSQSTANNYMRLFDEYGSKQISIFGATVESQTFANLPYSKALLLLSVPADEREEFAEQVNAEDLSSRELKAAIEERDKQIKIAEEQKRQKEEISKKLSEAKIAAEEALLKADEAEKYKNQLEEMQKTLQKEKDKAAKLKEDLKKAESDPIIPAEKLEQIRKEAESAAKQEAQEDARKILDELKKKADAAKEEAEKAHYAEKKAREELDEAQKKLKTASPEVAAFKALFDDMQVKAIKLKGMIDKIGETDPETAGKLTAALQAFGRAL